VAVERGQRERLPAGLELDDAGRRVHVLESFHDRADDDVPGLVEGPVAAADHPARVGRVRRSAPEAGAQRVVRVARAQDVIPAALGHLVHAVGVAGEEPAAFGDLAEAVPAGDAGAVQRQLFTGGEAH